MWGIWRTWHDDPSRGQWCLDHNGNLLILDDEDAAKRLIGLWNAISTGWVYQPRLI